MTTDQQAINPLSNTDLLKGTTAMSFLPWIGTLALAAILAALLAVFWAVFEEVLF
jgi:hypothetical protein